MRTLFKVQLAITIVTTIWMMLIAKDFVLNNGSSFSIMTLELPHDNGETEALIASMPATTKNAVAKQLNVDYIFMVSTYIGILLLCLIAIRRIKDINTLRKQINLPPGGNGWKKLLLILAVLQLLPWVLDIWENARIEQWLQTGSLHENIPFFTARTYLKFGIAFAGFFTAAGLLLLTMNKLNTLRNTKMKSIVRPV
ncbi:MAG: hypothetical protein QM791_13885 [Ferruginibacter sp.]